MNIWDDEDDNKIENEEVSVENENNAIEDQNKALEKRKDYRLFKQVKDLVKNLNKQIDDRVFNEILDVYEKLIRLKPDMLNVFKDDFFPKVYSKSLYLVNKIFKQNDSIEKTQRGKGTHFNKLKKLVESADDDITDIINDYIEDKNSDDELDLEENFGVEINIDEEKNDSSDQFVRKKYVSDDPAIRRLNWVKTEFLPDYIEYVKKKKIKDQEKMSILQKTDSIKTSNIFDSTITDMSNITSKKDKKDEKTEKILQRLHEREEVDLKSDEEVNKEYENVLVMMDQSNKLLEVIERLEHCLRVNLKDKTLRLKLIMTLINCQITNLGIENGEKNILKLEEIIKRINECNSLSEEIMNKEMSIRKNSLLEETKGLGDNQGAGAFSHKRKPRKISTSTKFEDEDEENHKDAFEMKILKENQTLTKFQSSISSILEKINNEIFKYYQLYGNDNKSFLNIAKNEIRLINCCLEINTNKIICLSSNYLTQSKISYIALSCLYYKKKDIIGKIFKNFFSKKEPEDNLGVSPTSNYDEKLMNLFKNAYNIDDNKIKVNVNLMEIYYLALNMQFDLAKEKFNKVNFKSLLNNSDKFDKLLYNKVLAQLGCCAFRLEKFSDAKHYLNSLCKEGKGKLKENLCQNTEYHDNLDIDDLKKLNPLHCSLNLEEIEVYYYITLVIEDLDKVLLERLGKLESNSYLKAQLNSFEKQVSLKFIRL
jgi:hypothetical protein